MIFDAALTFRVGLADEVTHFSDLVTNLSAELIKLLVNAAIFVCLRAVDSCRRDVAEVQ